MEDIRSSEQILADLADEATTAFTAELDFFEWRADHEYHDFPSLMTRYVQWIEAGEPLARSYARIATQFPQHMWRFKEIVLPIQREIFGNIWDRVSGRAAGAPGICVRAGRGFSPLQMAKEMKG